MLAIVEAIDRIREKSPDIRYICDPVLGDDGKFYCPRELVNLFKTSLIPKAWLITPNQFEAEQLTGIEIKDRETLFEAIK